MYGSIVAPRLPPTPYCGRWCSRHAADGCRTRPRRWWCGRAGCTHPYCRSRYVAQQLQDVQRRVGQAPTILCLEPPEPYRVGTHARPWAEAKRIASELGQRGGVMVLAAPDGKPCLYNVAPDAVQPRDLGGWRVSIVPTSELSAIMGSRCYVRNRHVVQPWGVLHRGSGQSRRRREAAEDRAHAQPVAVVKLRLPALPLRLGQEPRAREPERCPHGYVFEHRWGPDADEPPPALVVAGGTTDRG